MVEPIIVVEDNTTDEEGDGDVELEELEVEVHMIDHENGPFNFRPSSAEAERLAKTYESVVDVSFIDK